MPGRRRPLPSSPQASAGASVTMRTASSRVNSPRSRTQWPSRWVWIDESAIWLRWAPESLKVMTARGWRSARSRTASSWG